MTAKRYFGTDGIRGRVGEWPITAEFMLRLGRAERQCLCFRRSNSIRARIRAGRQIEEGLFLGKFGTQDRRALQGPAGLHARRLGGVMARRGLKSVCRKTGARRRNARSRGAECVAQGRNNQRTYKPRIAETHFRLGRMNIDVDLARLDRKEEGDRRKAVAEQEIRIGRPHRAEQHLVAHRAAVDEIELAEAVGA